jgi:small-conductance mechanosensitive channel
MNDRAPPPPGDEPASELDAVLEQLRGTETSLRHAIREMEAFNGEVATGRLEMTGQAIDRRRKFLRDNVNHFEGLAADLALRKQQLIDRNKEALDRLAAEDQAFWFRRFHTSLAIAHGAGFAAIGSKLFDPEVTASTAGAAWHPMLLFAVGMVAAGVIPLALYFKRMGIAWGLALTSASLLVAGLGAALAAVWRASDLIVP